MQQQGAQWTASLSVPQGEVGCGASACPCVESIQGSELIPVLVAQEVQLLGRNLRLFQVSVSPLQVPLTSCGSARWGGGQGPTFNPSPG